MNTASAMIISNPPSHTSNVPISKQHSSFILTSDADLRRQLFGTCVMQHPAKQNLPQLYHLLDRFAIAGSVLFDPFGGTGSIMLGASFGMQAISIESVPTFHTMQQHAWSRYQCTIDMQDCYSIPRGSYWPLLGDSRNAAALLSQLPQWNHFDDVDLIITSPPYHDAISNKSDIGPALRRKKEEEHHYLAKTSQLMLLPEYSSDPHNIGNQSGKKYLKSMAQVWQECFALLKSGGTLICITRDCIQNKQHVPVGDQNRALLEEAGLVWQEREIWHIPNLSFFRRLHQNKYPDAPIISEEFVDIYRKLEVSA